MGGADEEEQEEEGGLQGDASGSSQQQQADEPEQQQASSSSSSSTAPEDAPLDAAARHPGSEGMGFSYQAFCIAQARVPPPVPFSTPPHEPPGDRPP